MPLSTPQSSRRRWLVPLAAAAAAALVASGCGSDDDGDATASTSGASSTAGVETQDVQLLLPAPVGLNWTAFLIARERFWPQEGLDVEGVGTDGSSAVVQQIVSGNGTYGLAGASTVYAAEAEGADLVGIAGLTHDDVARLSVPEADTEIQDPADLEGKAIGITSAGDGSIPIVKAIMAEAGLAESDYELPIVGEGGPAVAQAFQSGRIQAYAHGVSDVAGLEVSGKTPLRSIMPEAYVGLPGNVLVLSQESVDDPAKLDVATKLARGWLEAAEFAIDDPAAAKEIACEQVPQACQDDATATLAVELATETTRPLDPDNPGAIDPKKARTLIEAVVGKVQTPIDEVLTNEHLAAINGQ